LNARVPGIGSAMRKAKPTSSPIAVNEMTH
jgi:hypothetical protein